MEPSQTVVRRRRAPSSTPAYETAQEIPPAQEEETPNRSQVSFYLP